MKYLLLKMKNNFVSALIFVLACSGCTAFVRTDPVASSSATPIPADRILKFQEKVTGFFQMTVIRDEGYMGGGCHIGLEIDGVLAARFSPSETAVFYVPSASPPMQVIPDPLGRGLCGIAGWSPVPETYTLKAERDNVFRISLGAYRRPRLVPMHK